MDGNVYRRGGGEGREASKMFTVAESIKSLKSLLIKITDIVDAKTLGNCKQISLEHEVYTRHDKLDISAGLGPSTVITAVKDIIKTFLAVRLQTNVQGTIL